MENKYETQSAILSPQLEVFEPCVSNVDASRTNMSAKQLLQLTTSDNNDIPFIINKTYRDLTQMQSPFHIRAIHKGTVVSRTENVLVVYYDDNVNNECYLETYPIYNSIKLVNNALTIKYIISEGDIFCRDEVLIDYTGQDIQTGIPKIGYRTKILYSSFFGYTADDAFVISESFAKRARVDYTKKILVPISAELKYFKKPDGTYLPKVGDIIGDDLIKYHRIVTDKHFLSEFSNMTDNGSKIFDSTIDGLKNGIVSRIKVHRLSEDNWSDIDTRHLFNYHLVSEIRELYTGVQSGTVNEYNSIKNKIDSFLGENPNHDSIKWMDELGSKYLLFEPTKEFISELSDTFKIESSKMDAIIEIDVELTKGTWRGDKFANLFAGKGVVSKVIPDHLMPSGVDVIFNPLGLFGRNNWGTLFEMALGKIIRDVEHQASINDISGVLDRITFINDNFIVKYDTEYSNQINELVCMIKSDSSGINGIEYLTDINELGFYIHVNNFPGIKYSDFYNDVVVRYEACFNINISQKEKVVYSKELIDQLTLDGMDNNLLESVKNDITTNEYIAENYFIKLFHTSDSKYNATHMSSGYSATTGQPLKGRNVRGGVHISWQTLFAIIGSTSKNNILKELYGLKSDIPINEKKRLMDEYIATGEFTLRERTFSRTKKNLELNLKMLGISFNETNLVEAVGEVVSEFKSWPTRSVSVPDDLTTDICDDYNNSIHSLDGI